MVDAVVFVALDLVLVERTLVLFGEEAMAPEGLDWMRQRLLQP